MFQDEQLDVISVHSIWKDERYVRESECQTSPLATNETGCQPSRRKAKETQTEDFIEEKIEISDDDSIAFVEFLRSVVPRVVKQLKMNHKSQAFHGYDPFPSTDDLKIQLVNSLRLADLTDNLHITGVAWNATGSVLAASYGRLDHDSWCMHKGALCTWNLTRRTFDVTKPDSVIDVPSCITCLAAHPSKPNIFVGGIFSGEIIIWSSGLDEETIFAASGISDDSHREPVTYVQFMKDPESSQKYQVLSCGNDGRILIWQIKEQKQQMVLKNGFQLMASSLPRELCIKAKRSDLEIGASCLSFNKYEPTSFFLGSESGGIFKCSTEAQGLLASSDVPCSIQLHSPVILSYHQHDGPVFSIHFSPFHRNLFLTCGADGTCRIYSMIEINPLLIIEPSSGYVYCVQWSPTRPMVFAACTELGIVLVYDLNVSKSVPVATFESLINQRKRSAMYTLQFNPHNSRLLAIGDASGTVMVLQLNKELSELQSHEQDMLNDLQSELDSN